MNAIPSTTAKFIEQQYINRVLNQHPKNIMQAQNKVLARFQPESINHIKRLRRFNVSGNTLTATHAKQQRFIDMKNIRGNKRNPIPVHNKVVYSHFNAIINQLAFGLTNDVKQLLAQQHNITL